MQINKVLVVAASFIITFFSFGIRYTYGMLLPEMMKELGLSNTEAGAVYTCFFIFYLIFVVITGFLVDVKSVKKIVIMLLPLLGIGTILMSTTYSYISTIVFFSIVGIGASIGWVPLVVWCQKTYPFRRRFVLGIVQVGCNLGWGTIGLILPLLLAIVGWRGIWLLLGVLSLSLPIPLAILAYDPVANSDEIDLIEHTKNILRLMRNSEFLLGGLAYLLTSFAIMIHLTFFKAFMVFELGLKTSTATAFYGIIGIIGIAGSLFVSLYSDKIGPFYSLVICNLILAIGLTFMALYASFIILPMIFIGISYGMIWPLYAALVKDIFKWEVIGSVMGIWSLMCSIGLSLSSLIGGVIVDLYGSYRPPYVLGALIALISILMITLLRKRVKLEGVINHSNQVEM